MNARMTARRTERTQVDTLSSSGSDQESSESLRISVEGQTATKCQFSIEQGRTRNIRKNRRSDESLSGRSNRWVEALNLNLTEEDSLVRRVGEHVDEIDRRGERIGKLERRVGDLGLGDVEREAERSFGDEILHDRRNRGLERDRSESGLERSDWRRVASTENDRVGGDSLNEVLQQDLSSSGRSSSGRRVSNGGGNVVVSGDEYEAVDERSTDDLVGELQGESDVSSSNRDVRGIEEQRFD